MIGEWLDKTLENDKRSEVSIGAGKGEERVGKSWERHNYLLKMFAVRKHYSLSK